MRFAIFALCFVAAVSAANEFEIVEVGFNFVEFKYVGGPINLNTVVFGGDSLFDGQLSDVNQMIDGSVNPQLIVVHDGTVTMCPDPQCNCGNGLCSDAIYIELVGGIKKRMVGGSFSAFGATWTGVAGTTVGIVGSELPFSTFGSIPTLPWTRAITDGNWMDSASWDSYLMTPGAELMEYNFCESMSNMCEQTCTDLGGFGMYQCGCNDTVSVIGNDGMSCFSGCSAASCPAGQECVSDVGETFNCLTLPTTPASVQFTSADAGALNGFVLIGGAPVIFSDLGGFFGIAAGPIDGEAVVHTCFGEGEHFEAVAPAGFKELEFDYVCDAGLMVLVQTFQSASDLFSPTSTLWLNCDGFTHTASISLSNAATATSFTTYCAGIGEEEEGSRKRAGETLVIDNFEFSDGGAAITGDPHLVGFDGEKYDLKGEDGKVFNLISDIVVNMNALLFEPSADVEGTFIESFGIVSESGNVFVHKNKTVKVGETFLKQNQVVKSGSLRVEMSEEAARITVEQYTAVVKFVRDETMGYARYLNIDFAINSMPYDIHGFLGQSARGIIGLESTGLQVEGEESDYEVRDGLFGSDFKFNRYAQKAKRSALGVGALENEIVAEFH